MQAAVMSRRAMGGGAPDVPTPGLLEEQPPQPQVYSQPELKMLRHGGSFDGDLRNLPQTRPRVREQPEREER
jgi:hypothetical protein